MKNAFCIVCILVISGFVFRAEGSAQVRSGPVPGRFVVKLAPGADPAVMRQALSAREALRPAIPALPTPGLVGGERLQEIYVVCLESQTASADDVAMLLGRGNIEWVEPDYYLELFDLPTDHLFGHQWYLYNQAQQYYGIERVPDIENDSLVLKSGVADKDIRVIGQYTSPPSDTTKRVIVSIVDTGVDTEHPELADHIWRNVDEIPYNNADDDHNGYVDDTVGFDISGDSIELFNPIGDADPRDSDGHGTHIAGIVAAKADGQGVVGIAPWVEIMPVKIMPNGISSVGAEAIVYAVNNGARVINVSWGSPFQSQILREALDFARKNGTLICIASGNSGDNSRFYPGGFDLDSTLIVGAGNSDGDMTYFSTYGAHVDIIAPGLDILSLRAAGTDMYGEYPSLEPGVRIIDEHYYLSDGTSMAAPMVVGAAALLWSFRPDLSLDELIQALRHGATDLLDPLAQGDTLPGPDTLCGWGYLNIDASLSLLQHGGMCITEPLHRSRHTGDVIIKGATIGGYTGGWTLEFAPGLSPDSGQWQTLASGATPPVDSMLGLFNDSTFSGFLNLRITDDFGRSSVVVITYSRANVLDLVSPVDGQEIEYNIPIYGSAYGPGYDSVVIRYRTPFGAVVRLHSSSAEYFDSLFYAWSASGSDTGDFRIYLFGYFDAGLEIDSARIHINSSFAAGWPRTLPGRGGMTAVSCDLNQDGSKELAVGTSYGLVVYRGDNGQVVSGFPVLSGRDVRCVPAVYDIDGDSFDEIIVTDSGGIHAFNHDGTYAEGWPQSCYTGLIPYEYAYPMPVIANLRVAAEPGAVPDSGIMIINKLGQLVAYRFNGERYFFSRQFFSEMDARISYTSGLGGGTSPFVTAADLDGDDRIEVVGGFTSPPPFTGLGMFEGANGRPAFGRELPTVERLQWMSGVALADLNVDGLPEVIASGADLDGHEHIWIRTMGNDELADWVVPIEETWNGWLASYPIIADLDLDGVPEILSTYFEFDKTSLFIYRADGTPYIESPRGIPGEAVYSSDVTFGTPAVANLLGDEFPEIIIRSGHLLPGAGPELVYIFDYTAVPIPGWPKATPAGYSHVASSRQAPLVDDIDSDGKVELVLVSDDNKLLVWDFDAPSNDGENSFRFLCDNRNSSILPPSRESMPSGGTREIIAARSSTSRPEGYPDRLRTRRSIVFSLPSPKQIKIEVFTIEGQLVTVLLNEKMSGGDHQIEFDGSMMASGTYFYRVLADGAVVSRKMLLMK